MHIMLRYVLELPTDACEKTGECDVGVNRKRPEMNKRLGVCYPAIRTVWHV